MSEPLSQGDWAERVVALLGARVDDLVVMFDGSLRLRYANRATELACRRTASQLKGLTLEQTGLFEGSLPELRCGLQGALLGTEVLRLTVRWLHAAAGAEPYVVELCGGGDPRQRHVVLQGRRADPAIPADTEHRPRDLALRRLAQTVPDIIIRYGLDGRATYCNREIDQQVAVAANQVVGRTPSEAAPPGMRGVDEYEAQLLRTLRTGEAGTTELHVPHPDHQMRVHSILFAAERDERGEICGAVAVGRDVTEQVRLREDLAARERQFRTLAENLPDVVVRYDREMRIVYCNPQLTRRSGVPLERTLGKRALETMPAGWRRPQEYLQQLQRTLETGESGQIEVTNINADGAERVANIVMIAERNTQGEISGALLVGRDISDQYLAARKLEEKEHEFRSLAENASDYIARWDTLGRVLYVNPAVEAFTRLPRDALIGRRPTELPDGERYRMLAETLSRVVGDGRPATIDLRFPGEEGAPSRVHQIQLVPERDERGQVRSVLGVGRDVTERVTHLEIVEALVRTDTLTRLPNRQALQERAPALFAAARRSGKRVAVTMIDLDQFKSVNDGLGHSVGDKLLCAIAQRLTECLRADDLLIRHGGDEFVVAMPSVDDVESLGIISAKLHGAMAAPLDVQGRPLQISASIGVALFPDDGEELEILLARADSAMYHAKRSGRGRTEYYRRELGEAVQHRLALEAALRGATDGTGLELYLQPQVDLHAQAVPVGAEALLRWHHPTLGLLTPDSFIELAEETGAIVPIGRWVLNTAATAAARWNQARSRCLRISVNVSPQQFVRGDLVNDLRCALADSGCQAQWLGIEITERTLLDDTQRVRDVLGAVRSLGVHVSLDDFGTGYSALGTLVSFPVDGLKIDKSFVQGVGRGQREEEIVRAFIAIASALKMDLVAEGVETPEQEAFLLRAGCRAGQGWRFGRPMPARQFEQTWPADGAWLRAQRAPM